MKDLLRFGWVSIRRWLREPRIVWRSESETLRTTIEIQQWMPFAAFLVALVWYIASPSGVVLMAAVTLGGLVIFAYLWARAMARGVRGQRKLRFAAMQVGDELEEQISLDNKTALPVLWAEYVDRSNIPGYTVSSARAADANSLIEWRAHTICTRRGVFNLGPWEMRIGEPFGILLVRQTYLQHQEILVYPPLAVMPERILPHRGAMGDHRPLNQPLRAETISSTSVRPYSPGDPLRHIHWRTTARHVDPYVKQFSPEAASNVWLVPDFDARVHLGAGDESSLETMVTAAASLAAELLQQNLAVGMVASANQESVVLPRQGPSHLWAILQALSPLELSPEVTLEKTLAHSSGLISGNDLFIVITPSLQAAWVGALRRLSRSRGSAGRGEVVLLDAASFGAPAGAGPSADQFLSLLLEQGIVASVLRRDDIRVISGTYGEISRWEFSVSGTGRAVAKRAPRAAALVAASGRAGSGEASPGQVDAGKGWAR